MATDGNVRCLQGSTLWEAVCTSNGNGRAPRKPPSGGRDIPGRLCPGMGWDGMGRAGSRRVSRSGYQASGIGRIGPGTGMRGTWAQARCW